MKKILTLAIVPLLLSALLMGCAPAKATEEQLSQAKSVIEMLNNGDYTAFYNVFDDSAKQAATEEQMTESVKPIMDELGAFKQFTAEDSVIQEVKDLGKVTAVLLTSEYANGTIIWQVAYNTAGSIIGVTIVG